MKRILIVVVLSGMGCSVKAQIPIIGVIGSLTNKIVVAIDIRIQRLQTRTLDLEVAEKKLENLMEETRLGEIQDWVQKQKDLYSGYYDELRSVKQVISGYERVKELVGRQAAIISRCSGFGKMVAGDGHFSAAEVGAIQGVISGVLQESVRNIGAVEQIVTALVTSMEDGDRLSVIDDAGSRIDRNYADIELLYQRTVMMSLMRAKTANDVSTTRALYGIQ